MIIHKHDTSVNCTCEPVPPNVGTITTSIDTCEKDENGILCSEIPPSKEGPKEPACHTDLSCTYSPNDATHSNMEK